MDQVDSMSAIDILMFISSAVGFALIVLMTLVFWVMLDERGILNIRILPYQFSIGVMRWGFCICYIPIDDQSDDWRNRSSSMRTWVVKMGSLYFMIGEG